MAALDYKQLLKLEREAYLREQQCEKVSNELGVGTVGEWSEHEQHVEFEEMPDIQNYPLSLQAPCHSLDLAPMNNLCYYSSAVSEAVERSLLDIISVMGLQSSAWKQLKSRRLQCWGDFPPNPINGGDSDLSAPMPKWLDSTIDSLVEQGVFEPHLRPNNVLINQYEANEGIFHHTDGPAYHGKVAILSLGGPCVMSFRKKLSSEMIGQEFAGDICSVVLEPRSLFIFEKESYSEYMHGIEINQPVQIAENYGVCTNLHLVDLPCDADGNHVVSRTQRVSITFRRLRHLESL